MHPSELVTVVAANAILSSMIPFRFQNVFKWVKLRVFLPTFQNQKVYKVLGLICGTLVEYIM
jgi:hypothetical protein